MIELFKHTIGPEEIERCVQVLKSNWHTAGPVNQEVEELISEYYQSPTDNCSSEGDKTYVALTSSCTSGLIALSMALGLKPGDEVVTTPMTFTATAASVMHCGAKPVFADIDASTGLIDINQIESKINEKTKAIYIVNLFGHMPNIKKIREIADKYKLFLIEDCAHAFSSTRDGYRPTDHSHAACYSFYATKNVHCGEGGAIISKDKDLIEQVKVIRRHGLSKYPMPGQAGNMGYDVIRLGFKGILSDINASLLIGQVKNIELRKASKRSVAYQYYNRLSLCKNITCIMPEEGCQSSWYTFPILVKTPVKDASYPIQKNVNRKSLIKRLQKEGIGHTIMYQSLETFSLYNEGLRATNIRCPGAIHFGESELSLPCYPSLTAEELEKIIKTIEDWDKTCTS